MDSKKRKAKRTRWLGIWLFLVCALLSAACTKSVIGGYGGGAMQAVALQPQKAAQQYAASKTIQASSFGTLSSPAAKSARVGQAVRQHSSLPILQASRQPARQIPRQGSAQSVRQNVRPQSGSQRAAVKPQPAKTAQAAAGKQLNRGKAAAVRGDVLCRTARSQVGTRYKYGGSTPKTGFDCSGLLVWAYKQHGLSIPRTAKAQSSAGRSVQRNKLAPGDIVVFRIKSGYHTGMYTGNNRFIHSPRSGSSVREDQLDSSYWKKAYTGARRLI
ncbi:MAG: C40 family peptidase [Deltaproteobacteria bacterium]|nr:C40 family peptidase [Deltaproteobacteria bacterium]